MKSHLKKPRTGKLYLRPVAPEKLAEMQRQQREWRRRQTACSANDLLADMP